VEIVGECSGHRASLPTGLTRARKPGTRCGRNVVDNQRSSGEYFSPRVWGAYDK